MGYGLGTREWRDVTAWGRWWRCGKVRMLDDSADADHGRQFDLGGVPHREEHRLEGLGFGRQVVGCVVFRGCRRHQCWSIFPHTRAHAPKLLVVLVASID